MAAHTQNEGEAGEFGQVRSNSQLLNEVYSVKRCISLQKSKAEVKRDCNQLPTFKPRKRAAKF